MMDLSAPFIGTTPSVVASRTAAGAGNAQGLFLALARFFHSRCRCSVASPRDRAAFEPVNISRTELSIRSASLLPGTWCW